MLKVSPMKPAEWREWAQRLLLRLNPAERVAQAVTRIALPERFELLALGKAAPEMVMGVDSAGLIPVRTLIAAPSLPTTRKTPSFEVDLIEAQHPIPGPGSFAAGTEVLKRAADKNGAEHLLVLLSGGTSALVAAPPSPLLPPAGEGRGPRAARRRFGETEKEELHRVLVKAGLSIMETNLIRRHCSGIKGGEALRIALNAGKRVTVLAVSDVYSDQPADIGSGPFAPDPTTFADALRAAERVPDLPSAALERLRAGVQGQVPENLRPDEVGAGQWQFDFLARPGDALTDACHDLEDQGEPVMPCPLFIDAGWHAADSLFLRWLKRENPPVGTWVVAIGEAEVRIPPEVRPGKGGRASHLVVALACHLRLFWRPFELAVVATDGVDGCSDLGGGFLQSADIEPFTLEHLYDTLSTYDSANFLQNIGRSFAGARSGTNFGDILLFRWLA